jgi:GT2 family glycosyltransferase
VLVADDSVDSAAPDLVRRLGDGIVTRVVHEPSGGMTDNWNRAVALGTSSAVLLLGQDDALEPAALSRMVAALEADPALVAVGCGRTFMDDAGAPYEPRLRVNDRSRIFLTPGQHRLSRHELTALCLRNGNPFGEPSAVLFRRSAYDAVGGYDTTYRHMVDVAFLLAIVAHGDVVYLPQPLVRRRRHPGSQTAANIRSAASSEERVRLIDEYAGAAGLNPDEIARCTSAAFVHSAFDLARAVRRGWSPAARTNLRLLRHLAGNGTRPRDVLSLLVETATSRNQDRR